MAWYDSGGGVDIGHDVSIIPIWGSDGEIAGIREGHLDAEGQTCQGYVSFRPGDSTTWWQVVSLDPLTLTPSILCRTCGKHGYITDGAWTPA